MSGAQPNDTDIQPNKILIHHRPEATTYIRKVRTQFCKLFRHKSPAELPVKVRHGHNQCFCKLEASIAQSSEPSCMSKTGGGWSTHPHSCLWMCCFQFPSRTVGIARSVRPSAHHLGAGSLAPCCYPQLGCPQALQSWLLCGSRAGLVNEKMLQI